VVYNVVLNIVYWGERNIMNMRFMEEQILIHEDKALRGTLTVPDMDIDHLPAVLIINGSGSADRDGNIQKPHIEANTYKDLAHFISALGFITLRYDKRGTGESEGNPLRTGMQDLVRDVICNIGYLKNHSRIDPGRIILLGHSEGCILATIAHTTSPVAGLILLGGAGTNLREPIAYQNARTAEEIKKLSGLKGFIFRRIMNKNKIEKQQEDLYTKVMASTGDKMRFKFQKLPAKWLREHFQYGREDILNILKGFEVPVLAITGDKDVQVDPGDIMRLTSLDKENIQGTVIKNMDHMLKEFKGEKTVLNLLKQYKKEASQPTHPMLEEALAGWLQQFRCSNNAIDQV
jgi:uncharacterized protein